MKLRHILYTAIVLLYCTSCNKWIDVKPTDRLSEDILFEKKEGFLKALNGVYVEMASTSLYGRFMTAGELDAMAQYYFITSSTNSYYDYVMFNYTNANPKFGFDDAWRKAYELNANVNVILEKTGASPSSVLPEPYFGLIRGEALALRAMLNFDMLRIFGPIWNDANKALKTIPYPIAAKSEIFPLLSSEEVMVQIERDLKEALTLLQNSDPILTEGVRNGNNPTGSSDLYYRQYRFNYFAVKALMARAALWKGDKTNALKYAKDIIEDAKIQGKDIFPAVTAGDATSTAKPDRMFSTEVIFSLYTIKRSDLYNAIFAAEQADFNRLSVNAMNDDKARINAMYPNQADYRYRIWESVNAQNKQILTNQKFKDVVDGPGRYMIPLIRLGEIYLIAAEASNDLGEATGLLNTLRRRRNTTDISPSDFSTLKTAITEEFRRELFGEGQLFFYYKRNAFLNIPNNASLVGEKSISLNNYRVPLPESEIKIRGGSQP